MNYSKIIGWLTFLTGLVIIGSTIYFTYNIFTRVAATPQIFEFESSSQDSTQVQGTGLEGELKKLMADHLPKYVQSTPDKQFRKNLEGYINQECWNDEILSSVKPSINNIENQNYREGRF